jgi:dienelactone hydrolase
MATVALFHSVLGLRKVEGIAADRMRSAGHTVVTPDLYSGLTTPSIDEGLELMATVGWNVICERAQVALDLLPPTTVLAGHSMGAGVVSSMWPDRIRSAAILLLHGLAEIPTNVRRGTPVSVHLADPDRFASPVELARWKAKAKTSGVSADVFTYPNVGHFYTDETLADYDAVAAGQTWERVLRFLDLLESA